MGRRRREDGEERLTEKLTFRLSPSELAWLDRQGKRLGCGPSTLARTRVFAKKPANPGDEPEVRRNPEAAALLRHLDAVADHKARVGNNINQIAHQLNSGADAHRIMHKLDAALADLSGLNGLMREALERIIALPGPSV